MKIYSFSTFNGLGDNITKRRNSKGYLIILLAALAWYFYAPYIYMFPNTSHAWAQCDRYALALGFIDNGFDLFHPQTYNLNPQFPADHPLSNPQGITRVDFPIHDYLIGLIMKVTHDTSPFYFRLYILLYSMIGLFFLASLVERLGQSRTKAIIVTFFVFCSPIFLFYQAGFLPTIPSIANVCIGWYYFVRYNDSAKMKHLYVSILFMLLAALSRTPFAVFFLAIAIEWVYQKRSIKSVFFTQEALVWLSALLIFGTYYLYNTWLGKTFGSVFLTSPNTPTSWQELSSSAQLMWDAWKLQILSEHQYQFMAWLAVWLIIYVRTQMVKQTIRTELRSLIRIAFVSCMGTLCYSILQAKQFPAHDYYLLDTFFPIIMLVISILLIMVPNGVLGKIILLVLSIVCLNDAFSTAKSSLDQRYYQDTNNRYVVTYQNYVNSADWLDSIGVSKDARILVLDAYTPNLAPILMRRKSFSVLWTKPENIDEALTWKFDYVVIQHDFLLSDVWDQYPAIYNKLKWVATNGKLSIYQKSTQDGPLSIERFLGLDKQVLYDHKFVNFDSLKVDPHLIYGQFSDQSPYSGKSCSRMDSRNQTAIRYQLEASVFQGVPHLNIWVSGMFRCSSATSNAYVMAYFVDQNDQKIALKSLPIYLIGNPNEWKLRNYLLHLEVPSGVNLSTVEVQLVNYHQSPIDIDDWNLVLWR